MLVHVHVHAHAHVHVHVHVHVNMHVHGHVHCAGTCIRARLGAHVRRALRRVDSRGGAQLDGLVSRGAARVHRDDARLWQQSREIQADIKLWHPLALALALALAFALALALGREQPPQESGVASCGLRRCARAGVRRRAPSPS